MLGAGLLVGLVMNLNFLAAGAVDPSAFYLLNQGALALWLIERRPAGRRTRQLLSTATLAATALALASVPFIASVHPAEVIDDPAVMLILCGALTILGCELAHHRIVVGKAGYPQTGPSQVTSPTATPDSRQPVHPARNNSHA